MRALARDRDRRYPTARALVDDLDRLAAAQRWTLARSAVGELVEVIRGRAAAAPGAVAS